MNYLNDTATYLQKNLGTAPFGASWGEYLAAAGILLLFVSRVLVDTANLQSDWQGDCRWLRQ